MLFIRSSRNGTPTSHQSVLKSIRWVPTCDSHPKIFKVSIPFYQPKSISIVDILISSYYSYYSSLNSLLYKFKLLWGKRHKKGGVRRGWNAQGLGIIYGLFIHLKLMLNYNNRINSSNYYSYYTSLNSLLYTFKLLWGKRHKKGGVRRGWNAQGLGINYGLFIHLKLKSLDPRIHGIFHLHLYSMRFRSYGCRGFAESLYPFRCHDVYGCGALHLIWRSLVHWI